MGLTQRLMGRCRAGGDMGGRRTDAPDLLELERRPEQMALRWADGREHVIDYQELRGWCPCATCSPRRDDEASAAALRGELARLRHDPPKVQVMGYGLSFDWVQGCSSGIWTYERLYAVGEGLDPDEGKPYVHGAW